MESWDDTEASAIIGPSYTNAEAQTEPPQGRLTGIAGVRGTYDWLHTAQSGACTTYTPDGQVAQLFPAAAVSFR